MSQRQQQTFNVGFKVRILVQFVHLFPPVKVIPPVRDDLLQVLRVKTIIELAVLQGGNRARLVYSSV